MESNFVDYVKIFCASGNGGPGSTHLLRTRGNPKGGPDGGDGGKGGDIILKGNKNLWTLLHLRYTKHLKAEHGESGARNQRTGAGGKSITIEVPLGTVAKNADTGEILFEITHDEEQTVLLPGGRGGLGNEHFKSSTFQTPRFAQPGEPGSEGWFIL